MRARALLAERKLTTPHRKGYSSLANNDAELDQLSDSFYEQQLQSDGWCAPTAARRAAPPSPLARSRLPDALLPRRRPRRFRL